MADGTVVRKIRRAEPEAIERLRAAGVATVHEAGATTLLHPEIRPIKEAARIAGSVVTVSRPPADNSMIQAAVEVIEPGDVLVVATTSPSHHWMFGELLAVSVTTRGCRRVGHRCRGSRRRRPAWHGFPVWAKTIHAAGTTKAGAGSVNFPVLCTGITVSPGDVVVADDDGVVVVERERAEQVLEAARRGLLKEEETRARLSSGEVGLDLYAFRQRLEDPGVRWVDSLEE